MTVATTLRRGLGAAVLAFAALTTGTTPGSGATPFSITTLDSVAHSGWAVSMVSDASGEPHIAYIQYPTPLVRYAHRAGGTWTIEDVGLGNQFWGGVAIALDSQGTPHIAFVQDDPAGDLARLAVRTPSGWTTEAVDPSGPYLDLALDGQDRPHLVYRQNMGSGRYRLRYARRDGAVWTYETADTGYSGSTHANNFERVTLALDPDGEPAISYHTGQGTRNLGFARRVSGAWQVEVPDGAGCTGFSGDVQFDSDGAPAVHYLAGYAGEFRLASKLPGGWTFVPVDDESWNPGECPVLSYNSSLAFDAAGAPRSSYLRIYPTEAALFAAEVDGQWVKQVIEEIPSAGPVVALALTPDGRPLVAYGSQLGLRFAEATGPIVGVTPVVPRTGFSLLAPAPNPVGAGRELGLRFALPREDRVAVSVTDVAGRRVWSSPARSFGAGDQSLRLELSGVAPGVYFVRLAAEAHGDRVARFVVLD